MIATMTRPLFKIFESVSEDPRRARIRKGIRLTSTPAPEGYVARRKPRPPDPELSEAAAAAFEFDRKHTATVTELARRFAAVRQQLEDLKARRK
jgi:hypothetical protein